MEKMLRLKFFLIFLWSWFYLLKATHSARVLGIFPLKARSHFNFHEAIVMSLLQAGHQVTMITPYASSHPHRNLTIINSTLEISTHTSQVKSVTRQDSTWYSNLLNGITNLFEPDCRRVMTMEDIQKLENFDIMFLQVLPLYKCFFPLAKKLDTPVIGITTIRSLALADYSIGNSRDLAVFPFEFSLVDAKMSFIERIFNVVDEIKFRIYDYTVNKELDKFYLELYPDLKPHNFFISLLFSNNHEIFLPRTVVPNAIDIGGIVVKSAILNDLPENLMKFITEAEHGVILFSLGTLTNSKTLPSEVISVIKTAFSKVPQRVIWKSDEAIEGISGNVLTSSWVPQKEILAHKNVLAFMSHCGISSTYEAIYFGKPMILLPLFNDQAGNAGILKGLGAGIYLDPLKLNEMELLAAIEEITKKSKYREIMAKLSKQFTDEAKSPSENVVYWTEYVLRHKGAQHLRWVGADIPSYRYFLLEIVSFLLVTSACVSFFLVISVKYLRVLLN